MASTYELENQVRYAQELVRTAQRQGLIDGASADQHLRALGVTPPAPETAVTITLRVTGDLANFRNYGGQAQTAVEEALRGAARQAGLTVVRGSTQVRTA